MSEYLEGDDDAYSLREVPAHLASSDLFTPFSRPRPTQTSVGYYLVKKRTDKDLTFGVHQAEYGGIGEESCGGRVLKNVPRTHNHLRTALDESIPPRVKEHNRKYIVAYNRGLYASPAEKVGDLVFANHVRTYVDRNFKEIKKSIFPRSVVYELDYIKNVYRQKMLLALEKERAEFEEKVRRKRQLSSDQGQKDQGETSEMSKNKSACSVKDRPSDSCNTQPPFWWPDKNATRDFNQTGISIQDDYSPTDPKDPNFGTVDIKREMKLDDPKEYQPGQVYKQSPDKESGAIHSSKTPESGWQPKNPNFHEQFDPSTFQMTSPLYEAVKERQNRQPSVPLKSPQNTAVEGQKCECMCHEKAENERLGKIMTSSAYREFRSSEESAQTEKSRCDICGCVVVQTRELDKLRPQDAVALLDRIGDDSRELAGRHLKKIGGSKPFEFPCEPPRYGLWNDSRQKELAKVGIPFKTEAARWMENNMDPLVLKQTEKPLIPWNITNL